jgi:hypothetical protein
VRASTGRRRGDWGSFISSGREKHRSLAVATQLWCLTIRTQHSNFVSDIFGESDEAFQNSGNRDEIIKFLTGVHSKLGLSHGFTRTNVLVNATTSGTFIRVTYESTFDQGKAVEAFTWRKAAGGLTLVRYDINSNIFITR